MAHIIESFKPFAGQHCETAVAGSLLNQIGIELSEPMIFGLGEGLGFIFWNMKSLGYPFFGGRIKQDVLTQNIARNLNLHLEAQETTSSKKAWENVKTEIDKDIAVGIKLDCFYLDYFTIKIHFAGHYVTMYGYDDLYAYLADTNLKQDDPLKTSLASLEMARKEKGLMSSNNLSYTIRRTDMDYHLEDAILTAIRRNALDYLNPPIKNIGYKGVLKASEGIKQWYRESRNIKEDFNITAMLMDEGGTGGALFRNMYRDFLKESHDLLKIEKLNEAWHLFSEIAPLWTKVSASFKKTAETESIEYIEHASKLLMDISQKEKSAMEILSEI